MDTPIEWPENIDEEALEMQRRAEAEARMLDHYLEIFEKTHPRPQPPVIPPAPEYKPFPEHEWIFPEKEYTFESLKGTEGLINKISTFCGIVFSAIRTAGIFGIAELKMLQTYSIDPIFANVLSFMAGASLIGVVEGVLAGLGFTYGRKSKSTETSWGPVIVAAGIAALAGIIPTMELLPDTASVERFQNYMYGLLTFLSGPGIAYLIIMININHGRLHNEWEAEVESAKTDLDNKREKARLEWDTKYNQAYADWQQSVANLQSIYDDKLLAWNADYEEDFRKKGRAVVFGAGTFAVKRQSSNNNHKPQVEERADDSMIQRVWDWLNDPERGWSPYDIGVGGLATPKDVATALDVRNKQGQIDSAPIRLAIKRLKERTEAPTLPDEQVTV